MNEVNNKKRHIVANVIYLHEGLSSASNNKIMRLQCYRNIITNKNCSKKKERHSMMTSEVIHNAVKSKDAL